MITRRMSQVILAALIVATFAGCSERSEPRHETPPPQSRDLGSGAGGEKLGNTQAPASDPSTTTTASPEITP
jgi:uncharacterized lipoprotein